MASARYAWGIDVGNRALKAVKLVRDGDRLRVDDFELIEHEHVLSNAGDNKESLIQAALANFIQRHPLKSGGVVGVGVAGQSSFARFIKLPPVEEKKIPEIVRFEAIQQIPFPLDDVEWSYQLFRTPESPDVEVGIFAMRKELVNRHIRYFTDFDMNVQVVQMNPLAVYNAVYHDQRLKGTTMVIDLGAENTDLIICDNDSVWMRSIPIGGNNFTETLVKAFKLPFAKAEDLKRNSATSKYARQIFQAMRPIFADLVAEIQRSIGFYASVHRDSRIKRVIALGGTFKLPGLQKYLQQNLSLDVERLDNLASGAPSDPKLAATFNENLLSVVSAYGLALQAMGEGKITSSLLPAAIRREKVWKEKTPIFGAAAACFVAGTGLALAGYFVQDFKFESAKDERSHIETVHKQAKDLDDEWSKVESAGASDREIIKNVMSLSNYRDLWANLLADVGAAVPKPQAAVVEGIAKRDVAKIKSVPRAKRDQVVIESISSKYMPSMSAVLKASDQEFKGFLSDAQSGSAGGFATPSSPYGGFGGPQVAPPPADTGNGGEPGAAGADASRGFLLTIRGTTPNPDIGSLVDVKFCSALKKVLRKNNDKVEYAIVKASLITFSKIADDPNKLSQIKSAYDAAQQAAQRAAQGAAATSAAGNVGGYGGGGYPQGGGFGGGPQGGFGGGRGPYGGTPGVQGGGGGGANEQAEDVTPYLDRLTGEDVRNDLQFTVLVAVQIDPPPAPAAPQASAQ